jgi:hypothetical protein
MRPEGLGQFLKKTTSSGLEPVTFQLAALALVSWVIVQSGDNFYIAFASVDFYCLKYKQVQRLLKNTANWLSFSRDGQYIAWLSAASPCFYC